MKKVFSCLNSIELAPYKNLLERHEIQVLVKNEFTGGALGEIPINESWPQLWVLHDNDEEKARALCLELEREAKRPQNDWSCQFCGEENASSFELCWHCEGIRSGV